MYVWYVMHNMFIENFTSVLGFLQATAQRVELQPDSTAGVNVTVTPDCGKWVSSIQGWGVYSQQTNGLQIIGLMKVLSSVWKQRGVLMPLMQTDASNTGILCSSLQTSDRVCEGVNVGQTVSFQVNVMLTTCTEQLRGGAVERWADPCDSPGYSVTLAAGVVETQ